MKTCYIWEARMLVIKTFIYIIATIKPDNQIEYRNYPFIFQ